MRRLRALATLAALPRYVVLLGKRIHVAYRGRRFPFVLFILMVYIGVDDYWSFKRILRIARKTNLNKHCTKV